MNDVVLSVIRIGQALLSHTFLQSVWIPCPTKTHVICDAFKNIQVHLAEHEQIEREIRFIPHCLYYPTQLKALTASEALTTRPHFWTRRPSATARPGFTKSKHITPAQTRSMGGSCFNVWGVKCKVAQLCLWPANAENLLNRGSSAANKGQHTEQYWTWLNMSAFASGKGLLVLQVRLLDWLLVFLNSSVVAAAIKVPATFWTVQDTMGASGQATSAGDKDELEPTQQCNYRSNGSNFVFKMISELPWKFQVSKGLVNFFTESNVPRLAQDIHHRLVWQRAGEAGNVLWEGRWMGQLT